MFPIILDSTLNSVLSLLFALHIIILLLWAVVLLKHSVKLRKKAKYSTLSSYNQDSSLQALNSKVEYRKSLFLFAIVLSELASSVFTFMKLLENIVDETLFIENQNFNKDNVTSNVHTALEYYSDNCNITRELYLFSNINKINVRLISNFMVIPLILKFSSVYTLMSYYVLVTKKSLNYNSTLKSVDLSREQKILLLSSIFACILLSLLLVRIETYLVFALVQCIILLIQLGISLHYRKKLVLVTKWKILDTKIAFGTDHYLYKSYTKSLKIFKLFVFFYIVVVVSFCLFIIVHSLRYFLTILLYPYIIYHFYSVCIYFYQPAIFIEVLEYAIRVLPFIDKVFLLISILLLLVLNSLTVPHLLSKMNLGCRLNFKRCNFRSNRNLREHLL